MPSFIPATGITLHLAGVCVNRIGVEGTTFTEVVDQLRRSFALQYLKDPGFASAQIAWLLGYEGQTSFNHAFRRWTGRSPSAARKEEKLPALK